MPTHPPTRRVPLRGMCIVVQPLPPSPVQTSTCAAGGGSGSGRSANDSAPAANAAAVQQRKHVGLQAAVVPAMVNPWVGISSCRCRSPHIPQLPNLHRGGCGSHRSVVVLLSVPCSSGVQAVRSEAEIRLVQDTANMDKTRNTITAIPEPVASVWHSCAGGVGEQPVLVTDQGSPGAGLALSQQPLVP